MAACIATMAAIGCAPPVRPIAPVLPAPPTATEPHAPGDIAGQWQGTLEDGKSHRRLILKIARAEGGWTATFYSIDQGAQPFKASAVVLDGAVFQAEIESLGIVYNGTLSADGNTIAGTRIQDAKSLPLTLERATPKTAWKIPAPPPPPRLMAAEADVAFGKASIKPSTSGAPSMQALIVDGRDLVTRNSSAVDLISFAYEVQAQQVVGGPDWLRTDRFDVVAPMEQKGVPTDQQLRTMIKKLLAERFHLAYHADKASLSAYVLTAPYGSWRLTPTAMVGPLPGIHRSTAAEGVTVHVRNGTLEDLSVYLQSLVLDRPVVDQTGLTARFDFHFTYKPGKSDFNGHPPKLPPATVPTQPAPDLFQALHQQLGLELTPMDTFVDVMVIDQAGKPGEK